jgi:hypothetical protein
LKRCTLGPDYRFGDLFQKLIASGLVTYDRLTQIMIIQPTKPSQEGLHTFMMYYGGEERQTRI